jgi:hypothetical protein
MVRVGDDDPADTEIAIAEMVAYEIAVRAIINSHGVHQFLGVVRPMT